MRLSRRSLVVVSLTGVCAAPLGCGDDDPGTGGSESSSESSTSTTVDPTTSSSSTTAPADTSSSSDEGSSSESTTAPAEVIVGGKVQDLAVGMGIPDAAISIIDMPGFETTSDAEGNFTLAPLPPGTEVFIAIEPSTDYFGSVIGLTVPDEDEDGETLAQISRETVDGQIEILQDQMPEMADLTQSIVITRLLQNLATGATIDFQPAPMAGTYYAPDENGVPVLNQNVVEFSFLPVVVYFNVAPGAPGEITITAEHPDRECTVVHPSFPTIGEYLTLVDIDCPTP